MTFSLMVDLQIRVFTGGGMGCFQLVSSIKVSLLIKAFCLRGGSSFLSTGCPKKSNNKFVRLWTLFGILDTFRSCPKGSKKNENCQMANPSVFDHFGPFWAHRGPFGPFQTTMIFLRRCFGANNQFLFEMLQRGLDGPKRVPNDLKNLG